MHRSLLGATFRGNHKLNLRMVGQFRDDRSLLRLKDSSRCFSCFHGAVATKVEVLKNEKAAETRTAGECFHSCFLCSQTFATISITIDIQGKKRFYILL